METELYKIRSLAHCAKVAYELYASNFGRIVRRTWLPALVLSVVLALGHLLSHQFPLLPDAATGGEMPGWQPLAVLFGTAVAALPAAVWTNAAVASLLNGMAFRANLGRMARLAGVLTAIAVVALAVVGGVGVLPLARSAPEDAGHAALLSGGVALLAAVVVAVCMLPIGYSATKYSMEPSLPVSTVVGKAYRRGWRHWGLLCSATLLTGIVTMVLGVVVLMPVAVTQLAFLSDQMGVAMGDASGLPATFPLLVFMAVLASAMLMVYVMVWVLLVFYYLYGTIEARRGATLLPPAPVESMPAPAPDAHTGAA